MADQATLQGNWNQFKGEIKQKWGQLTDDDLSSFNGNVDQLVGRIQARTGESRQAIEDYLDHLSGGASNMLEKGKQMVQDTMHRGSEMWSHSKDRSREAWNQATGQIGDTFSQGYHQTEHAIQSYPAQSVAVAFAAGLVTGLGLAMLFSQREETTYERGRRSMEDVGDQVYDALQRYLPSSIRQYMNS